MRGSHFQTIIPSLFRKVKVPSSKKIRITTPDDDFLDLDFYHQASHRVVIISHGLEGNSKRQYVLGMVSACTQHQWDVIAWNFRSCSGEMNRQVRLYHSGASDDLETVIHFALAKGYKHIHLVGFSMGGNITLKYLGEQSEKTPKEIQSAVTISVPVDLTSSAKKLEHFQNKIYMIRFLNMLGKKVKEKSVLFPEKISYENYDKIKSFREFDDRYTAPIHGFKHAADYWEKCSSMKVIHKIHIPTLLINAKDDTFLGDECFPIEIAKTSSFLHLEIPTYGGHCGFMLPGELFYSEKRTVEFILGNIK